MTSRLDILETPAPGAVLARLSGFGGRDDQRLVADFAAGCECHGWRSVVLDLSDLGGMTRVVAEDLARLRRDLDDRGGALILVAPNVAVHWLLAREFGTDPECAVDVASAFTSLDIVTVSPFVEIDHVQGEAEVRTPIPFPVVRPERGLAATLASVVARDAVPEHWLGALSVALDKAGLAEKVVLSRRRGDRLQVVGREDPGMPAEGWLGSTLAMTGVLLDAAEISERGLTLEERAYLRWCGAELHLPLVHAGELVGLLSLVTGRGRGLAGLRSGEVLALECLGLILASRLSSLMPLDTGSLLGLDQGFELSPVG